MSIFSKIRAIGHALTAIGEPMSDKDLLLAVTSGLGSDNETIVSLIAYQMDEINDKSGLGSIPVTYKSCTNRG